MNGKRAKKIRKSMPSMEPVYKTLPWGQVICPKRQAYQKVKGR